jgi:hypothetical protein
MRTSLSWLCGAAVLAVHGAAYADDLDLTKPVYTVPGAVGCYVTDWREFDPTRTADLLKRVQQKAAGAEAEWQRAGCQRLPGILAQSVNPLGYDLVAVGDDRDSANFVVGTWSLSNRPPPP